MKQYGLLFISCLLAAGSVFTACNNQPTAEEEKSQKKEGDSATHKIKEENVSYTSADSTMNSFIAYDESIDKKRPAVLILPEWWGLNDYTRARARQLAAMGYIAMAVDLYGFGRTADTPDSAQKLAAPFYKDPHIAQIHFDAALAKLKTYPQTDANNVAAIGYCFGGAQVLNIAKQGEDIKGVVSFHGNLAGVPARKDRLRAKILVCHGEADQFVKPEEVAMFKKQMDSIGADYSFKSYPGATHAFTNPNATAVGQKFNMPIAYNAAADSASWKEMKQFFDKIFK